MSALFSPLTFTSSSRIDDFLIPNFPTYMFPISSNAGVATFSNPMKLAVIKYLPFLIFSNLKFPSALVIVPAKDAKKYKSADSANFLGLENKLKKAKIKNH